MMDILFRSIARAGGIEVPDGVRIVPLPRRSGHGRRVAARSLRSLGRALYRLGDRLVAEATAGVTAPALAPPLAGPVPPPGAQSSTGTT